jgi:biopolymer transport protein ExbD
MSFLSKNIEPVVSTPGYNVTPQYDLKNFRKYIDKSKRKSQPPTLPLTSMIDMFSMVVIFLILNFSSTGDAFFVSRGVVLPEAKNADLMRTHPLISIMNDRIFFDAIPADSPKIELEERKKPYPKLRKLLRRFISKKKRDFPNEKLVLSVNIQADQNTSMRRVKEVMKMLVEEGWTGIQLTVKKKYD